MQKEDTLVMLEERGVFLNGHFQLASGLHSSKYIGKMTLYHYPGIVANLCFDLGMVISGHFDGFSAPEIEVVVGPERGGHILSNRVAEYLENCYHKPVISLFARKNRLGLQQIVVRDRALVKGKRVLVVDDVLTTGWTVEHLIDCIQQAGGEVWAAAVIFDRSPSLIQSIKGVPVYSLFDIRLETWRGQDCPLCKANMSFSLRE